MINFSTLQGLTIPEGKIIQIIDGAGNVLWSPTIKFTINGDTYIANRGMTWTEWFASDYNTTGKTIDDVQYISVNGNMVETDSIIVYGTAYEVGFEIPIHITKMDISDELSSDAYLEINGQIITEDYEILVPLGTVVKCCVRNSNSNMASIEINNTIVTKGDVDYELTITSETNIRLYRFALGGGKIYVATAPNVLVAGFYMASTDALSTTINGVEISTSDFNYNKPAIAYAIGSVCEFTLKDEGGKGSPNVKVNGNIVFSGSGKYSYIITRNMYFVTYNNSYTVKDETFYYGSVEITEY